MKSTFIIISFLSACFILGSCDKDAGLLPKIAFKTASGYVSSDITLAKGAALKIGIDASKSEDKDVLKKFNISKSVNGAAATTVFTKDLSRTEGDNYTYDYSEILENAAQTNKYTFTVTNRDGLVGQVTLTVTIQ